VKAAYPKSVTRYTPDFEYLQNYFIFSLDSNRNSGGIRKPGCPCANRYQLDLWKLFL